jgi:signal transduction histidine kinase
MRKPRLGIISIKVTFWVSVVVIAIVAVHIYWTKPERRFFEQKMKESERIAQIIETHMLAEMMAGEPDNIQRHMEMLPNIAGIRSVEITNTDMEVRFSSDSTRVGRRLDVMRDPPCQRCHVQPVIPDRLIYDQEGFGRVFAVDHVLTNDGRCSKCHEDAGPVVGNILVEVSMTEHDLAALAARRRLVVGGAALLIAMLVGMAAIIHLLVGRPAARLLFKMNRVRHGDFEIGAPRRSGDEFDELERGFHGMVDELRGLYNEMEAKIQQRTQALYETQAQVMHQEKLANIGQLAAGVAHEIGNPLTAIDSMVQLLTVESDDPHIKEKTDRILQQVDRISEIVHGMSDLSRPLSMEVELVDVNDVIHSVLGLVRYDARFKRIDIKTTFADGLPPVRTVEDRLFGVCLNLMMNAADAMPDGGALTITTRLDGDVIEMAFHDTGVGIPPDHIGKVFDLYFTTKEEGSGTGLGLSLCRVFFESMGGNLMVESEVGVGTVFRARMKTEPERVMEAAL